MLVHAMLGLALAAGPAAPGPQAAAPDVPAAAESAGSTTGASAGEDPPAAAGSGVPADAEEASPAGSVPSREIPAATDSHAALKNPTAGPPPPASDPAARTRGRGRLRGQVRYSRREQITGAVIALVREGDPTMLVVTASDEGGIYRAEGIPEGRYSIFLLRDGVRAEVKRGIAVTGPFRAIAEVTVAPGRGPAPVVDLAAAGGGEGPDPTAGEEPDPTAGEGPDPTTAEPPRGSFDAAGAGTPDAALIVMVETPDGKPREGARFRLRSLDGSADPLRGETDARGLLRLPRPPAGTYEVSIESPGHLPLRVDRLAVGSAGPLAIRALLVDRPYAWPGTPSDLLPDEKPLPPPGGTPPPGRAGQEEDLIAK